MISHQQPAFGLCWKLAAGRAGKKVRHYQLNTNSNQEVHNMEQHVIDNNTYQQWLEHLCNEIDKQRLKAMMQLNAATLQHYWWLGNDIIQKQKEQGWGAKVIDQLSVDLQKHYGSDSGYSARNLGYMKSFAAEYPDFPFLQVPLAKLQEMPILQARLAKFTVSANGEFVQVPLAQITWYHHISMISKVKDTELRAFYMTEAAIQGWSRDIMLMQIDNGYHTKALALPNNFSTTLPPVNSDLAKAGFKDPYNLGFVDMTEVKQEQDLEDQLASKVTDFLLELGRGFSYLGRQFPLKKQKHITLLIALLSALSLQAQIVVIPDVHGRSFWKEAVAKYPEQPILFLGDYMDPYAHENITQEDALANFEEILAFKQANKDRVTLLIGNHEIHYFDTAYAFSRKDTLNSAYIHRLLLEHLSLFSIASCAEMGGKTFLFTHAGILEPWWKKHFPETPTDAISICQALNGKMENFEMLSAFIDNALMDVNKQRGGEADAGSCLWADLDEHDGKSSFLKGIYQVFGHTQLRRRAVIKRTYADLDCRRAFLIQDNGRITSIRN